MGLGYAGQSGTLVLHRIWEQGGVGGGKSKLLGREVRNSHRTEKKTKTHESPVFIGRSVKRCIRWKIKKNSAHKFKSGQGGSWKENLSQQVEGGGDFL